jgi:hypothetical protein
LLLLLAGHGGEVGLLLRPAHSAELLLLPEPC